jgi:hypothetical protein
MNLEKFVNYRNIVEAREVNGIYEFQINGLNETLKVKVEKCNIGYRGRANLEVRGKDCIGYYRNLNAQKTEEDALWTAVDGFFLFFSIRIGNKICPKMVRKRLLIRVGFWGISLDNE